MAVEAGAGAGKSPERGPLDVEPDVPGDAYSEDGVDLTLIRWMLSLTCTERLQVAQEMADTVDRLREARER